MSTVDTTINTPIVAAVFTLLKLLARLPISGIATGEQDKLRTAHTAIEILAGCDTAHPEALATQIANVQALVRPLSEHAQAEAKRLGKILARQSADGALDAAIEDSEHIYRARAKALAALDSALGYAYIALRTAPIDTLNPDAIGKAGAKAMVAYLYAVSVAE